MKYMFSGLNSTLKYPEFYMLNLLKTNFIFEITYDNTNIYKSYELRILGEIFIEKYKDKGGIIFNNYELELNEYLEDFEYKVLKLIKLILYK